MDVGDGVRETALRVYALRVYRAEDHGGER